MEPADAGHGVFLSELAQRGVRALISGVHAIAYYAQPRYCQTLEVFVEADFIGLARNAAGATVRVVASLPPVTFEDAWPNRVEARFAQQRVFFIGRSDYLRNREASHEPYASWDADVLRRFL